MQSRSRRSDSGRCGVPAALGFFLARQLPRVRRGRDIILAAPLLKHVTGLVELVLGFLGYLSGPKLLFIDCPGISKVVGRLSGLGEKCSGSHRSRIPRKGGWCHAFLGGHALSPRRCDNVLSSQIGKSSSAELLSWLFVT